MEQNVIMTDQRKSNYFYEEAMKTLRTNIQYAGRYVRTIMFTSCMPNEGKSDLSMQIAREFGNLGKKVLLVDADIRKSALAGRYKVQRALMGLSDYLSGQVGIDSVIYKTNFENLDIIFAGPVAPNPSELLEDTAFGELMKQARNKYDYIFVDTPPIGSIIDAAIVARQCDGAVFVIQSESISYHLAQRAKEQLEKTGCKILGVVLNKVDVKRDKYYGHYYYKYYGSYGYGGKAKDGSAAAAGNDAGKSSGKRKKH
ncbi:MAG: CpsD/CapB family tyrosine-protein kinase [Clostridiales bacterium]|nr:CpsD/CapB family tyrosine-protein kinase [Clostridiales bacterium]